MQYIKILLDHVLQGNEFAFNEFCLSRINHKKTWRLMNTLNYFCVQAKLNPEISLNNCYPEALIDLALFLQLLPDESKDNQEVYNFLNLLKLAAENNNPGALAALIILYRRNKKLLSAEEYYIFLIKAKSVLSIEKPTRNQLLLSGLLCLYNLIPLESNGSDNRKKAINCFINAGDKGNTTAMLYLGLMYQNGQAGQSLENQLKRDEIAVKYYQRAADLGNVLAIVKLGWMYKEGRAETELVTQAERDEIAVQWFETAVAVGDVQAMYFLGSMYKDGRAGDALLPQKTKDIFAIELFQKGEAFGEPMATMALGFMIASGRGESYLSVQGRSNRARYYYEKALDRFKLSQDNKMIDLVTLDIEMIDLNLKKLQESALLSPLIASSQENLLAVNSRKPQIPSLIIPLVIQPSQPVASTSSEDLKLKIISLEQKVAELSAFYQATPNGELIAVQKDLIAAQREMIQSQRSYNALYAPFPSSASLWGKRSHAGSASVAADHPQSIVTATQVQPEFNIGGSPSVAVSPSKKQRK